MEINEVIGWHRAAQANQEHWRALQTWAWIMAHDPSQGTMLALGLARMDVQDELQDEVIAWVVEHPEVAVRTSGLCPMYGHLGVGKGYGLLKDYLFRRRLPSREDIEIEQVFETLEVVCTGSVAWTELKGLSSKWSKTEHGFTQGAKATLRWGSLAPHRRREIVEQGLERWLESKSLQAA